MFYIRKTVHINTLRKKEGGMSDNENRIANKAAVIHDIWLLVKSQGISFVMMVLIVLYFHTRNESLIREVSQCQDEKIEILLKALNENTKAIEKVSLILEISANNKKN